VLFGFADLDFVALIRAEAWAGAVTFAFRPGRASEPARSVIRAMKPERVSPTASAAADHSRFAVDDITLERLP
jgi:hypothetical protein